MSPSDVGAASQTDGVGDAKAFGNVDFRFSGRARDEQAGADAAKASGGRRLRDSCQAGDERASPAAGSDAGDDVTAQASPSPTPPAGDEMPDTGDETPSANPTPSPPPGSENVEPQENIEPPLPQQSTNEEQAANEVPLPENPPLEQQFSQWDMAQVETPLFLNAAINEFNERPILITGNWSVKPHLSLTSYYDGNVFLSSQDMQSDFIARLAPGISMRLGSDDSMFYVTADYTAGFDIYTEHPQESTIDQSGMAQFQWSLPRTTVDLNLNASSSVGQDIDVTDRVRQNLYFAGVTTHYAYGEKTSFDISADYTRSDYDGLISSSQLSGNIFFNYQYSPKTQLGFGAGTGALMVPGSARQVFEDADLRATYQLTGKITLIAEGGMELRQFGDGGGSSFTPIFILEGAWIPRVGTELDLSTRRSIYASAILDSQDYAATALDLTARQRITDYVDVSLAAGYVNTDYIAAAANVDATRQDNYYYIRPAVEWKALSWMSIGLYYQYSRDTSQGGGANSFSRDTGGVDIAILF